VKWYWSLAVAVFIILGLMTLIPAPASKPCLLGYYAHCSITPVSTVICWVIAGGLYWFGKRRK
jgi:ABC-type amino acid transport system permease subunit